LTNNTLAAATTTIVKIAIIVLEKCSLLSLVAMKLNPPSLACAKTFASDVAYVRAIAPKRCVRHATTALMSAAPPLQKHAEAEV
jgi:hypothetical protein